MMQSVGKASPIRFVYLLNMLPIIGLLAYYYTRYLEGSYSFIIPLGLSLMWIVLSLMTGKVKGLLFNTLSVWWMVYYSLYVFMVIVGLSSTNFNFVISRTPLYLIPAMGHFIIMNYNKTEKVLVLVAFFVIFLSNLGYNIIFASLYPELFEEHEVTIEAVDFEVLMNVANTFFVELCYLLIGTLLITVLVVNKKGYSFICLLLIAPIAYYMLFQNTRGTAILLLVVELIGMFLAYYEPTQPGSKRSYYLLTIATLTLFALIVFIPLMGWLMEYLPSERLAKRFNDLVALRMSGGDMNSVEEGSFTSRVLLAQTSLNSFLSSPISVMIGIGDHSLSIGGDLVKSGIGNHSEFIDVLARFGLIGAFVFLKIMKCYYLTLKQLSYNRRILKYINVLFWIIVISGFLNLLFVPLMLLFMYIVLPIIIELTAQRLRAEQGI